MPFLTIDVGGADLDVEVLTSGASWEQETAGIDVTPAYSGKGLITKTYDPVDVWVFTALLLTLDGLAPLRAAAQYPVPISVSGDFPRTVSTGGAVTVTNVTVQVGRADYQPIGDTFYYQVPLTIRKVG